MVNQRESYLVIGRALYEMGYDRLCISPIHWNEMGEMLYLDPEVVQGTIEIIRG